MLDALAAGEDEGVWADFDARYRPILVAVARRKGLGEEESADAAQEALVRFVGAYRKGRYDRSKGRLSAWLLGIARNCIADAFRDKARIGAAARVSQIADEYAAEAFDALWDEEIQREMLRQAIDRLRSNPRMNEKTLAAFELVVLQDVAPSVVADRLSMAVSDVYVAKHRCLTKLRVFLKDLAAAYELDGSEVRDG